MESHSDFTDKKWTDDAKIFSDALAKPFSAFAKVAFPTSKARGVSWKGLITRTLHYKLCHEGFKLETQDDMTKLLGDWFLLDRIGAELWAIIVDIQKQYDVLRAELTTKQAAEAQQFAAMRVELLAKQAAQAQQFAAEVVVPQTMGIEALWANLPPQTQFAPAKSPSETALILIDVQQGFSSAPTQWGIQHRSTPNLETNIERLLSAFRSIPESHVFHVHHHSLSALSPLHHKNSGVKPMPCALPHGEEKVIVKHKNSAFVGTVLEEMIRERKIKRLVFCGLTTCHCVSTSVRMASNLDIVEHGYGRRGAKGEYGEIVLVSDATAMWGIRYGDGGKEMDGETAHQVHLESLKGEFCDVYSTQQVIEELLVNQ